MKRIYLRSIDDPEVGVMRWSDVIRQVVRRPLDPQQGASIDEMRSGIRVLDALERADDVLELEDADWEHLCAKVRGMQWGIVDRRIVQLVDEILQATEHAAAERPPNGTVALRAHR